MAKRIADLERQLAKATRERNELRLAVLERANALVMDLWDLCNANAPIGPGDCRTIGESLARKVGEIRVLVAGDT